ncbi:MAG: FAD-linked oxidase C-terminal domain-containing protein, partial [Candidatus Bathyarchaeia archaeon]
NISIPMYGHAADGNLHPMIMDEVAGGVRREDLEKLCNEAYAITVGLGGVITGEHGVGKIKVKYLNQCLTENEIKLMKKIKEIFDPNNILNPGTILP